MHPFEALQLLMWHHGVSTTVWYELPFRQEQHQTWVP